MRKRDVIIVGAGVGGASAGYWCAKKGLDALMLEKEQFPRDKVCGDGQVASMHYLLKDMGIYEEIEKHASKLKGSALIDERNEYFFVKSKEPYFCTPRYVFDDIVNKAAVNAGVDYMENFEVTEIMTRRGKACGVRGIHNGKMVEIESDLVILASGSHSMLSRQMGFFDDDPDYIFYGIRGYYDNVEGLSDFIEFYYPCEEFFPAGYIWLFPMGGKKANVGVFITESSLEKWGKTMDEILQWWIDNTEIGKERLGNATITGELKGWRLPTGKRLPVVKDGIMAVGDAGNMIEPLFGGGCPHAMASGRMAAEVAAQAIAAKDFSAEFLEKYEDMVNAGFGKGYIFQGLQRKHIFNSSKSLCEYIDFANDFVANGGTVSPSVPYLKEKCGVDIGKMAIAGTFSK